MMNIPADGGVEIQAEPPSGSAFEQEPQTISGPEFTREALPPPGQAPGPRRRIWPAAAAVAFVLVAASVFFLLRPSASSAPADPLRHIRKSLDNTISALVAEQLKQTALSDIVSILSGGLADRAQYTLSVRLSNLFLFGDLGFRIEARSDPPARRAETDFAITMSGFPLGGFSAYLIDDLVSVAAPILYNGEYGFRLDTLGRDFNASALSRLSGITLDEGMSLPLWSREIVLVGTPLWLPEANRRLTDAITVEKLEDREIAVNGFPRDCETYEIKAGAETIRRYIRDLGEGITSDSGFSTGFFGWAPYDQSDDISARADSFLNDLADSITGDLSVLLFINSNRLIRADFMLPFNLSEPDELTLSIQVGGAQNLSDALSVDAGSRESGFILKWAGSHAPSDGKYNTSLTLYSLSHHNDEPLVLCAADGWYDANLPENNFAFLLDIAPDFEENIQLSLNGSLRYSKAGKTLDADFSQSYFSAPGLTQAFTASFSRKTPADLNFTERDPVMLFSLSADEIKTLMDEIQSNINGLLNFGGLF